MYTNIIWKNIYKYCRKIYYINYRKTYMHSKKENFNYISVDLLGCFLHVSGDSL